MKINKFKKISSNKYKIFFDNNTITLYEDVILKYNLLYKKDIDGDLLIEINKENYGAGIYDTAVKYIGIRMRSEKEITEYLLRKKYDEKDIRNTINKLINNNLINDELFAKSFINDKLNFTNDGLNKIKLDLSKLGVNDDIINSSCIKVDNNVIFSKLEKIINKEIKLNDKLPITKLKNKIINRCINLGYSYEDINDILDNINLKSNSNIKSEYDKLYKKYSIKYEGYKLNEIIKSKLYSKGYTIEEINNI